jgi:hypothetical protein
MMVDRPDAAWCADITYFRLAHGFIYLVAILDWHSRYVLAWSLLTTLEKEFFLEALRGSLWISRPEIFNTDQGAQFTSPEFTSFLEVRGSGSAWTAAAGSTTTSLSSVSGVWSSTKRSIFTNIERSPRPGTGMMLDVHKLIYSTTACCPSSKTREFRF